MKPTLVCKASNKGVLIIGKGCNTFYPNVIKGKAPAKNVTEDEQFIRYCLSGIKKMSPEEVSSLHPDRIREIQGLNRRALTTIVRLKRDVANSWSKGVLKPFLEKCTRISEHETVKDLIIDDVKDLQLDIDIPHSLLVSELLKLKDNIY